MYDFPTDLVCLPYVILSRISTCIAVKFRFRMNKSIVRPDRVLFSFVITFNYDDDQHSGSVVSVCSQQTDVAESIWRRRREKLECNFRKPESSLFGHSYFFLEVSLSYKGTTIGFHVTFYNLGRLSAICKVRYSFFTTLLYWY